MTRARVAALLCVVVATLGARGVDRLAAPPPVALAPDVVLQRYEAALAARRLPKALSFDYTVEQLAPRNIEQTHRVYRSGLRERDETLVVDGYTLSRPSIRIFNNRTYRYDIGSVAPARSGYAFDFAGAVRTGGEFTYVYRTVPRAAESFAVSEMEIDGRSFLPSVVRFKIAGGGARGSGTLRYGRSESYWVVREARVNAHLTDGSAAHERIAWSNYQFPAQLPASTFESPRAVSTPPPAALEP